MTYNTAAKFRQILASVGAFLGAFSLGTVFTWPSLVLPDVNFSTDQEAQIGALVFIGAMLAPFIYAVLDPRLGKKWSMLVLSLPCTLGWVLLALAGQSVWLFYLGRILTGLSAGSFVLSGPAYTIETAEPSIRGGLSSMMQLMITFGCLVVYPVGCSSSWEVLTWVCASLPALMFLWLIWMPRSPTFLLTKGKEKEAREALIFFRGKEHDIDGEIKEIQTSIDIARSSKNASFSSLVKKRMYYQPFFLSMMLMFIQEFSGVNYIAVYVVDIFKLSGSSLDDCLSATIVMITQSLGTLVAVFIIDRLGRKILLIVSCILSGLSLVGYGGYVIAQKKLSAEDLEGTESLPLICLITFSFFFSIGLGPIPWILNVELFPTEVRGLAASICTAFNWFISYLTVIGGSWVEQSIGAESCYFIYGGVCLFGAIFTIFFIPETKGRTELELRELFN